MGRDGSSFTMWRNAWPADLVSGSIPDSTNRVNIMDLTSFLAPVRRINTSPGDVGDRRWDLVLGQGVFQKISTLVI